MRFRNLGNGEMFGSFSSADLVDVEFIQQVDDESNTNDVEL